MPTVIDSLLIELGFSTTGLKTGEKAAVDSIRKVDEAREKSTKTQLQGQKSTLEGLEKYRDSLTAIGTVALTVAGAANFYAATAKGNAALGRQAALLGMAANELDAWGAAAGRFGGTSDSVSGGLQNIESSLAKFSLGRGGGDVVSLLAQLGIESKNGTVDLYKLSDALKRLQAEKGAQSALTIAQGLGFDQGGYQLLVQGSSAVRALVTEMQAKNNLDKDGIKKADELAAAQNRFEQALKGVRNEIFSNTSPAVTKLINDAADLVTTFGKLDNMAHSIPSSIAGITAAILGLLGSIKMVRALLPGPAVAAPAAGAGAVGGSIMGVVSKWLGVAGLALHSGELNSGEEAELARIRSGAAMGGGAAIGGGKATSQSVIDYFVGKGWSKSQAAGIAANLSAESGFDPSAVGDKGKAYGVAQWHPDRQADFEKFTGKKIQGSSVEDQLAFVNYELTSGKKAAVGELLKSLTSAQDAGALVSSRYEIPANGVYEAARRGSIAEGMVGAGMAVSNRAPAVGSGGTSEVNINTINVQTQATDANGVARGLSEAIRQQSLINYSIQGAR